MRRAVVVLSSLMLVFSLSAGTALARQAKGKSKAKSKAEPTPGAVKPEDEGGSAVASCKKHVESMLKESAETRFQNDQELRVERQDGSNYDISGWVTSKSNAGGQRKADFNCHATRYGGTLWTTKTSLSFDR